MVENGDVLEASGQGVDNPDEQEGRQSPENSEQNESGKKGSQKESNRKKKKGGKPTKKNTKPQKKKKQENKVIICADVCTYLLLVSEGGHGWVLLHDIMCY